jgi:hypothetical protein
MIEFRWASEHAFEENLNEELSRKLKNRNFDYQKQYDPHVFYGYALMLAKLRQSGVSRFTAPRWNQSQWQFRPALWCFSR